MDDFSNDFIDFMTERLVKPFSHIEKTTQYKLILEAYELHFQRINDILKQKNNTLLDKLITKKDNLQDLYIKEAYKTGFIDGITLNNSIKNENKK